MDSALTPQNISAALMGTLPRIASLMACLWFLLVCTWSLWRSFSFLKKSARLPKHLDDALIITVPVFAHFVSRFGSYLIADDHGIFGDGAIFSVIDDLIFNLLIILIAVPVYIIAAHRHRRWQHDTRTLGLATALVCLTGLLPNLDVITMLIPANSLFNRIIMQTKKH